MQNLNFIKQPDGGFLIELERLVYLETGVIPQKFVEAFADGYKQWAQALNSTEYGQTQGQLFNETQQEFCCLGILGVCKIPNFLMNYARNEVNLTTADYMRALTNEDYPLQTGTIQEFFWRLNDEYDKSFEEIAEVCVNISEGLLSGDSFLISIS